MVESDIVPFQENRDKFSKQSKQKAFMDAMVEIYTQPMVGFQFDWKNGDKTCESLVERWLAGEDVTTNVTAWDELERYDTYFLVLRFSASLFLTPSCNLIVILDVKFYYFFISCLTPGFLKPALNTQV